MKPKTTEQIQKELDLILEDCQGTIKRLGMVYRFVPETSVEEPCFNLQYQSLGGNHWFDEGYSISTDFTSDTPYCVERLVVIRGVYRTKNGDGWPDETDVVPLKSFARIDEAFVFIMAEIIKSDFETALQNAAEERMFREDEKFADEMLAGETAESILEQQNL